MDMNLFTVAFGVLMALVAVAVVAFVVVIAVRRRSSPSGPEADYDDTPPAG
jgi:hypothetical protein